MKKDGEQSLDEWLEGMKKADYKIPDETRTRREWKEPREFSIQDHRGFENMTFEEAHELYPKEVDDLKAVFDKGEKEREPCMYKYKTFYNS